MSRETARERAQRHLSQFAKDSAPCGIKGFLFVDDEWLCIRVPGVHYQLETDPEVIAYVAETWIDLGRPGTIGTMHSPSPERPHCVICWIT